VTAYQTGERFLPLDRETLEFLEEGAVDQWCVFHATAAEVMLPMISVRTVSGVWPSA